MALQVSDREEHRRQSLAVRAPRLGVLTSQDASWEDCLSLIEQLTGLWGGATYAIFPTNGSRISPRFWRLLKRHDPDWFVVHGALDLSDELRAQVLGAHSTATSIGDYIGRLGPGYPQSDVVHGLGEVMDGRVLDVTIEGTLLARF
jgi:hypothetical protein